MSNTPRLSIARLVEGQFGGEVIANTAFEIVDAFAQLNVKSRTLIAQPGGPADGDAYILPVNATGSSWATNDGKFARFINGAWSFHTVKLGYCIWVDDENNEYIFDGTRYTSAGRSLGFYRQVGTAPERWYVPNLIGATALVASGFSATLNVLFATPMVCERGGTIDRLGFATGASAAGNMRLGIYKSTSRTDIRPGGLVYESVTIPVTTFTTYKHTVSPTVTLNPGELYYVAIQGTNTTLVQSVPLAAAIPFFGGDGSGNFPLACGVAFSAANTGALPATFPASPTVVLTVPPALWVRYSG